MDLTGTDLHSEAEPSHSSRDIGPFSMEATSSSKTVEKDAAVLSSFITGNYQPTDASSFLGSKMDGKLLPQTSDFTLPKNDLRFSPYATSSSEAKLLPRTSDISQPHLPHVGDLINSKTDANFALPEGPFLPHDVKGLPGFNPNIVLNYDETNKVYYCHLCDFRTAFRNSLLNHQAVHSDLRPWVCTVCEYAAKRKQDLKKHLHIVHGLMVESTQLKPVAFPGINNPALSQSSWNGNLPGKAEVEQNDNNPPPVFSSHPMSLPTQKAIPHSQIRHIKQESVEEPPSPTPGCKSPQETPSTEDDDLPISFFPHTSRKEEGEMSPSIAPSQKPHHFQRQRWTERHAPPEMSLATPVPHKRQRRSDTDDAVASSSGGISVSISIESQTRPAFMCEHCDIMFFQRAMYLMHAGLHHSENPWCCTVCNRTFTEKYSFTSHFINEH